MSNHFDIIPNIVPKQGNLCGKLPDDFGVKIKTTGLAGGMLHAFKAIVPAARHGL